jgi:hypothetical protein
MFVEEMFSLMTLQPYLATVTAFLRNEKDTVQELLLRLTLRKETGLTVTDIDADIDTNTDTNTNRGHDEDCCCKWEPCSHLVKTTGHLEFWWCPSFYWRSQWIEETRDASFEQGFYNSYCLFPLHGCDPAVGGQDL